MANNKNGIICGAVLCATGLMVQGVVAGTPSPTTPATSSPGIAYELAGKQYAGWYRRGRYCWRQRKCIRWGKNRRGRSVCVRRSKKRFVTVCRRTAPRYRRGGRVNFVIGFGGPGYYGWGYRRPYWGGRPWRRGGWGGRRGWYW